MLQTFGNDLDYLGARLHARRGRMAEGARLDELCRLRTLPELSRAIYPGVDFSTPADFQRRLVEEWAAELARCLKHLDEAAGDLLFQLLARLQLENVKILLRGFLNRAPLETLQPHLLRLPPGADLDAPAFLSSKSLEEFAGRLPFSQPRQRLLAVLARQRELPPFFLEAALDAGCFQELLARAARLDSGEAEIVRPVISQEAKQFQFLLVLRGKFHFNQSAESLSPLLLSRARGDGDWLPQVLSAPDLVSAATAALGNAIDAMPPIGQSGASPGAIEIAVLEALAWQRYLRLANLAFRRSHMGAAAAIAYFCLRRLEVANLITLSECIRQGVDERESRARLIPRTDLEAAHV